MKARVSISQYHGSDHGVAISIVDDTSGTTLVELEFEFESFGKCVTGLGAQPANVRYLVDAKGFSHIGLQKQNKQMELDIEQGHYFSKYSPASFNHARNLMFAMIQELNKTEAIPWELSDDGMSSQQNKRGKHIFYATRYVQKGGNDA